MPRKLPQASKQLVIGASKQPGPFLGDSATPRRFNVLRGVDEHPLDSVAQILSQTGLPLCTTDAEWTTTEHFISTARVRLEGWQEGPLKAHTHLVPRALKTAVSDLLTALKRGGTNAKLSGTPNQVAAMRLALVVAHDELQEANRLRDLLSNHQRVAAGAVVVTQDIRNAAGSILDLHYRGVVRLEPDMVQEFVELCNAQAILWAHRPTPRFEEQLYEQTSIIPYGAPGFWRGRACPLPTAPQQEPFMGDLAFDGGLRPPKLPYPSSGSREAVQDITSLPDKNVDSRAASGRPRPTALPLRPSAPTAEPRGKDSAAELAQKANTLPGGNETGSARVGERCRVFWPQDKEWHEAIVAGFEPVTARHSLKYTSDANEEWLDLEAEQAGSRLQWLPSKHAAPAAGHLGAAASAPESSEDVPEGALLGDVGEAPSEEQAALVDKRLGIWWRQDRRFYYGTITAYDAASGRHTICYDDGNLKTVSLSSERVDWTTLSSTCLPPTAPGQGAKPGPAALAADAAAAAAAGGYAPQPHQQPHDQQQQQQPCSSKAEPSGAGPELQQRITQSREPKSTVDVICNNLTGMYHVDSIHISLPDGTTMSPTEFERRAGKASAKKWKQSIRVHKGKGQLGMTMREWLRKQDAEASKTPAARAQEAAAQLTDGQAREGDVEAQHAGPATQTRQTGREARKLRSGKAAAEAEPSLAGTAPSAGETTPPRGSSPRNEDPDDELESSISSPASDPEDLTCSDPEDPASGPPSSGTSVTGCPDLSPSPDPPASGLVAAGSSAPAMDAWQVRFRLTSNMVKTTKQALMDKLRNTVGVDLASRATHILAEIQDPNVLRPYALLPESSFVKVQSRAKLRCVTGMSTGDLGPMTVKQFSQMKSKGLPVSEVVEYSTDGAIWKAFTASNVCNDLSG